MATMLVRTGRAVAGGVAGGERRAAAAAHEASAHTFPSRAPLALAKLYTCPLLEEAPAAAPAMPDMGGMAIG